MCGIYGVAGFQEIQKSDIQQSVQTIKHRGPDDQGLEIQGKIAISMCRLAINELSTGRQPFINARNALGVVFNGEIYNYQELTYNEQLPIHTSEAELISHLYGKYGDYFVAKLDGMFAIAIADFSIQEITLYRDPFGKKPLWVHLNSDGSLEFASEIKALRSPKNLRKEFISEYLSFGYIPNGKSPYLDIECVPPGSFLKWRQGKSEVNRYWTLTQENASKVSYKDAKEKTRKLLKESVSKRLISERPVGIYLSGGYDSSLVAALMKQENHDVNSYSVGFNHVAFDETKHALEVANFLELNHHQEILEVNVSELVKEVYEKLDIPFADSSILPTYLLSKFAKNEIVVALGGDGGDEVFGGYDRYIWTPIISIYGNFLKFLPKAIPGNSKKIKRINRKLQRFHQELNQNNDLSLQYRNIMSLIKDKELIKIVKTPISEAILNYNSNFRANTLTNLRKMMLSDVNNYLLGDLLVKADLASMFNSIELRSPLLDKDLAEYVYSLPDKYLVSRFRAKRILKDIAHELVPKKILKRPKMGFGVPMADWLRADLKELMTNTFSKNRTLLDSWIDMTVIDNLIRRHQNGEDHSRTLWPVLALALWAENNL